MYIYFLCSLTIDALEAIDETYGGENSNTSEKQKTENKRIDSSSDNTNPETHGKEEKNEEESTVAITVSQHLAPDQLNTSTLSAASSVDNLEEGE